MSEPYQLTLHDYLDMAQRRAGLIAATFVGVLLIGLGITVAMPPVYQSTATIVIESQQVPTDMVQATVTSYADERIEIIKQRVMTRENLLRIIDKYQLYDSLGRGLNKTTPSEAIDEMRNRIDVTLVTANVQNRAKGAGTIAFKLSYEDRKPDVAQKVTNDLVTLFLDENVKARTERASQTTEFLSQEATKLKTELETLEKQIADYKLANGNALPENITLNTNTIQRQESDLRSLDADSRAAQEELRSLELELSGAKAGLLSSNTAQTKSPELELTTARDELARLQATYTDNHPDVRAIKRKIAGLEKALAAGPKASADGGIRTAADLQVARIETRIKSTRERIAEIGRQQAALRGGISAAESHIMKAPQVERGLAALTRDYQNAQKKYDEIRAKQMTAQVAENMEGEQRAERCRHTGDGVQLLLRQVHVRGQIEPLAQNGEHFAQLDRVNPQVLFEVGIEVKHIHRVTSHLGEDVADFQLCRRHNQMLSVSLWASYCTVTRSMSPTRRAMISNPCDTPVAWMQPPTFTDATAGSGCSTAAMSSPARTVQCEKFHTVRPGQLDALRNASFTPHRKVKAASVDAPAFA